ncbi:MAG TPA: hypothetical protein VKE69_06605 [Planctomycetota bacterium]|nr:hypothetical protein [Planctomycetota bacterium]
MRFPVALLAGALGSCALFPGLRSKEPTGRPSPKRYLLPGLRPRIDETLGRPYDATTPFGSSGDRLWATSPQGFGFDEGIHFLYRTDFVPYRLRIEGRTPGKAWSSVSHVHVDAAPDASGLEVSTDKFLTIDDVAVVVVTARAGAERATLDLEVTLPWAAAASWDEPAARETGVPIQGTTVLNEIPVALAFGGRAPGAHVDRLALESGRPTRVRFDLEPRAVRQAFLACALDTDAGGARQRLGRWLEATDAVAQQVEETQRWFDTNVATFDCSDPLVTKVFWHRAYLLRKDFFWPRLGRLSRRCCAEGRWRSTWYPNVISYGAAHQIREARWLADPSYAWGELLTWIENPRPDGIFPSHVTPAGPQPGQYADWIASTPPEVHAVHPDEELLGRCLGPCIRNAEAWLDVFDRDHDALPAVDSHWWTGMEWQPSFFAFEGFRPDEGDGKEADLERVDLASYVFGGASAVAETAEILGRPDVASRARAVASRIRDAVETKLWSRDDRWFYSVRESDDEPARVKEVVGVYPFYFGLPTPGAGYEAAWDSLLDPEELWGDWPVRSCSARCPAYHPGRAWPVGHDVTSSCMWNGPTWPHANSVVMTAMARALRDYAPSRLTSRHLFHLFTSHTRAQVSRDGRTTTGEYYNADTGAWLTDERDYEHSTYLDVLIPELIGLRPRNDDVLEIDPLLPDPSEGGWSWFLLDGQSYRGRSITIAWDSPGGLHHLPGMREGFSVYVNGKLAGYRPDLGRIEIPLR